MHDMHECFGHETTCEHHTLLNSCRSNGRKHHRRLLQVILMHTQQSNTRIKGGQIAQEICVLHLGCRDVAHAAPVACPIHLHKHILPPIIKIKTPMPNVVPSLMAPTVTATLQSQQLHEPQLIAGDERLARLLPGVH